MNRFFRWWKGAEPERPIILPELEVRSLAARALRAVQYDIDDTSRNWRMSMGQHLRDLTECTSTTRYMVNNLVTIVETMREPADDAEIRALTRRAFWWTNSRAQPSQQLTADSLEGAAQLRSLALGYAPYPKRALREIDHLYTALGVPSARDLQPKPAGLKVVPRGQVEEGRVQS